MIGGASVPLCWSAQVMNLSNENSGLGPPVLPFHAWLLVNVNIRLEQRRLYGVFGFLSLCICIGERCGGKKWELKTQRMREVEAGTR